MEPQNSTVAGRVSPPSVSDIKSEKPTATEPRITNDKEGSRKQKDAIRKLASYNSEVGSRMEKKRREVGGADSGEKAEKAEKVEETEGTEGTEGTEVAERVEKVEGAEESIGESVGLSNGNIIAGMGVAVAAICLYLSYRSGAPGGPPLPPPPPPPPQPPQPPRFVGSVAQSSGSAFQPVIQAPRFMRL